MQEEPKNMGARAFVRRRLLEGKRDGFDIEYIGRGYRASPSEGYAGQHAVEQERIVTTALSQSKPKADSFVEHLARSSSIAGASTKSLRVCGPIKPSRTIESKSASNAS